MKIEKIEFSINATNLDRMSLFADAVTRMEVKLPHIVTTLALMTEFSPYQGNLDLYDVGFHAHWQIDGKNKVEMELTQNSVR